METYAKSTGFVRRVEKMLVQCFMGLAVESRKIWDIRKLSHISLNRKAVLL